MRPTVITVPLDDRSFLVRIGVDARNLVPSLSGIGRYLIETARHLAEQGHEIYFYLPEAPSNPNNIPPGIRTNISTFRGALPRIFWGNTQLPKLIERDRVDVLWGPAHRLPYWSSRHIPKVLTIHDLVWYHAASTMRPQGWLAERVFMKPAIQRADRIVAISGATRDAICSLYPSARDKIDIVSPGCTPLPSDPSAAALERFGIDRSYVLFVGTLEPRKNLINLLKAYSLLPQALRSELRMVIAGGQGWKLAHLQSEIANLNIASDVLVTGFVSDVELGTLYANAKFLVMPSLYEGFGLPIIEANAAGVPALTSRSSSMPEVGGNAALLVDPTSPDAIADGLTRMATDSALYAKLSAAAKANAARFDWANSARELTKVFEETIAGSR